MPKAMFKAIKYHRKLHKLFAESDKNDKTYFEEKARLRKRSATQNELLEAHAYASSNNTMIQDEIDTLSTNYWIREANRRFIPIPKREEGEYWEKSILDGESLRLTASGVSRLRDAVRSESRASRELWAIAGTVVTGVIGAVTGLIAVWGA